MGSVDATLPAMKTNPKFIFFTDFDGTITQADSNDFMTDTIGFGTEKRKAGNRAVLDGKSAFRDEFRKMMDSITRPFDQCIQYLIENITLDPGFKSFFAYARENNIPIVVLSGGMTPIIKALLLHLIGKEAEEIQIVSNMVASRDGRDINTEGGWQIQFHDDSHFGHDKSIEIRKYAALPPGVSPIRLYAGDGVSDLSAARECNLLFSKRGKDLTTYCVREKVPFEIFDDWTSIHATVKKLVDGEMTVEQAAAEGMKNFEEGGNKI